MANKPPKPRAPSPAETAAMLEAVRAGAKYKDACIAADIDWAWAKEAWAEEKWRGAVLRCRHGFEVDALLRIQGAAKAGDWKADAWLLERLKKDRYSEKQVQEVNVNVTALPFRSVVTGETFGPGEAGAAALPDKVADAVVLPNQTHKVTESVTIGKRSGE